MAPGTASCYAGGMVKWVLTLTVLGALVVAVVWYPIRGRTVLDRWRTASGPVDFAERSAREAKVALGFAPAPRAPQASKRTIRSTGGTTARPARPATPAHPTEGHTDEDRAALERLLADQTRR